MSPLELLIRASRAMQLEARRERSRSKALRAAMRTTRLASRNIISQTGGVRANLEAGRLLWRLKAGSLPPPPGNVDRRDMKPAPGPGQ